MGSKGHLEFRHFWKIKNPLWVFFIPKLKMENFCVFFTYALSKDILTKSNNKGWSFETMFWKIPILHHFLQILYPEDFFKVDRVYAFPASHLQVQFQFILKLCFNIIQPALKQDSIWIFIPLPLWWNILTLSLFRSLLVFLCFSRGSPWWTWGWPPAQGSVPPYTMGSGRGKELSYPYSVSLHLLFLFLI